MKRRGTICILLLGLMLITATACGSNDKEATSQQPAESDTNVTITADGNIGASFHRRLTFGSGGKIDKIYVNEGDKVNKGDVLAKLDTSALELAEAQAQVALTQARVTLTQAQVALELAKYELDQVEDVDEAKDKITEAEYRLEIAEAGLKRAFLGADTYIINYWKDEVVAAQLELADAKQDLEELLAEPDYAGVTIDEVKIKIMQVELAEESLEYATENVNLAQKSLDKAKKDLEEAVISSPFSGIVASVGAEEGEFLSPAAYTGTTIVELVDTRHMELTARVDELDIVKVKIGQKVMISVDAAPGTKLEGQVTFISPVAREPVGVLLFEDEDEEKSYVVKINFDITEDSPIRAGMSATAEIIVE